MRPALRRAKKKLVRTPGGKLVWHRVKKKRSIAYCAICGKPLHGERRNRVFGNLCAECARRMVIERVRVYAQSR